MLDNPPQGPKPSASAPLRLPVFRNIWWTSLISNFGQLILGVGAAWEMTRLTTSPSMVAMVQTAMLLPLMLVAVPAGAIADMFDRRKVAMIGLTIAMGFGAIFTALAVAGMVTPWVILIFCFLIGAGVALYVPAWQSSVPEMVPSDQIPAAIALGSISFNLARSFGPAVGGLIVLAAGAQAAFAINAIFYLPLFVAYLLWARQHVPARLPPERIDRAIVSGVRYVANSRPIRTVLMRIFLLGLVSATASALAPLIAKELLGGDASIFGILLGSSGVGAVVGAMLIEPIRARFGIERSTQILAVVSGVALVVVGLSRSLPITCLGMMITGGASIISISLLNVSVQLTAPRWVTARALSLFSSAMMGGIAIGSLFWGMIATRYAIDVAVMASGIGMLLLPLITARLPLPQPQTTGSEQVELGNQMAVGLALTMRSGPVVIEVDYDVDPDQSRDFYDAMRAVQRLRMRNGGFNWSLSRDIAAPDLWTERFECPTWGDYLRLRDRFTQADKDLIELTRQFDRNKGEMIVRRRLERPFGSVRWKSDSPDPQDEAKSASSNIMGM